MRNCTYEFFNIVQKESTYFKYLMTCCTVLSDIEDVYSALATIALYFKNEYELEVYPRFVKEDRYYLMLHEQASGSDVAIILC